MSVLMSYLKKKKTKLDLRENCNKIVIEGLGGAQL
jgi:hypothetical protein